MTALDATAALYLTNAIAAIEAGTLPATARVSDICPECDQVVDGHNDSADHVVTVAPNGDVVVLVGCEGYWAVDPNLVGVPSPNWLPDTDPDLPEVIDLRGLDTAARYAALSPGVHVVVDDGSTHHLGAVKRIGVWLKAYSITTAVWLDLTGPDVVGSHGPIPNL